MFAHNKRLQYTVRVAQTNPGLANLLEQFGGLKGNWQLPVVTSLRRWRRTTRDEKTCCLISRPRN